jgi:hypothetical protein
MSNEKSMLTFAFHIEALDCGTTPVRSKVTALVKRAPQGGKKVIKG